MNRPFTAMFVLVMMTVAWTHLATAQDPPPKEPGSWTLHVFSRGGLTGRGAGDDFTISSVGTIHLESAGVTKSLAADRLNPFVEYVRNPIPDRWTGSTVSTCSDCYTYFMVLQVRDSNGALQTHKAFWDPTTRRTVPAGVLRLYQAAMALKE